MPYTDYEKLKLAIPEQTLIDLTDDAEEGQVDMDKIAGCIEAADSEIDGYIPDRYELPLAPVPRVVTRLSTVMTIYYVYSRYAETIPETRQSQYDNAVKMLRELILTGKISLRNEDPAASTAPPSGNRFRVSSRQQIFTDDKLKGF